jgi:hypothetical protein
MFQHSKKQFQLGHTDLISMTNEKHKKGHGDLFEMISLNIIGNCLK